jgi:hypothetical protein
MVAAEQVKRAMDEQMSGVALDRDVLLRRLAFAYAPREDYIAKQQFLLDNICQVEVALVRHRKR